MNNRNKHPNWRLLYLVVLLAIGLLALEIRAPLTEGGHRMAEIGILLLTYGVVEMWFLANRQALLIEDREKYRDELLRTSSPTRLPVETRLWIPTTKSEKTHTRGIARLIPAWLMAALAYLASIFHQ